MSATTFALSRMLKRWAVLTQLGFYEANNGRTFALRMAGIARARRQAYRYCLLALGPITPLLIAGLLGWNHGPIWWSARMIAGAWAATILIAMAIVTAGSAVRAARRRLAMDKARNGSAAPDSSLRGPPY